MPQARNRPLRKQAGSSVDHRYLIRHLEELNAIRQSLIEEQQRLLAEVIDECLGRPWLLERVSADIESVLGRGRPAEEVHIPPQLDV